MADYKTGYGIASFVLGLGSLVFFWAWFISIPAGILAIIFFFMQKKEHKTGLATAGLVLGIIGLVAVLLMGLVIGALLFGTDKIASGIATAEVVDAPMGLLLF